jgi:hypothetical protein
MSGVLFYLVFLCLPRAGTRGPQGGSIHKVRAARRDGVGLERQVGHGPHAAFCSPERPSSSPLAALAAKPGNALAGIERKSHGRKRLLRKLG